MRWSSISTIYRIVMQTTPGAALLHHVYVIWLVKAISSDTLLLSLIPRTTTLQYGCWLGTNYPAWTWISRGCIVAVRIYLDLSVIVWTQFYPLIKLERDPTQLQGSREFRRYGQYLKTLLYKRSLIDMRAPKRSQEVFKGRRWVLHGYPWPDPQ